MAFPKISFSRNAVATSSTTSLSSTASLMSAVPSTLSSASSVASLSARHITVVPDDFAASHAALLSEATATATVHVTLSQFLDPQDAASRAVFDAGSVQDVVLTDWCFMGRRRDVEKRLGGFARRLEERYRAKFGDKPHLVRRLCDGVKALAKKKEDKADDIELQELAAVVDEAEQVVRAAEARDLAFTFYPMQFLYPRLKTVKFTQTLHRKSKQGGVEVYEYAPVGRFLSLMPGLHLQLTDVACLEKISRIETQLVGLELYLGEKMSYKEYGNTLLEKFQAAPLEIAAATAVTDALKKAMSLETLVFVPPSGTTMQQYGAVVSAVNKLPKLRDVTTGHYYGSAGTTLPALEALVCGEQVERCAVQLLVLDTSVEHFAQSKLMLPQVTSLEIHRSAADWHMNSSTLARMLAALRVPNLKHLVDATELMGHGGRFFLDAATMASLETYRCAARGDCGDALENILPLLCGDHGLAAMPALRRLELSELEFSGTFARDVYAKAADAAVGRRARAEVAEAMALVSDTFLDLVRVADRAGAAALAQEDVEHFTSTLRALLPVVPPHGGERVVPLELLVAAALDPARVLTQYYPQLAWPGTTAATPAANTGDELCLVPRRAYDRRVLVAVLAHAVWDVVFGKLAAGAPHLEYVGVQQQQQQQHTSRGAGPCDILSLPRVQLLAKTHATLEQVSTPATATGGCTGAGVFVRRAARPVAEMYSFGQTTAATRARAVDAVLDVAALRRQDGLDAAALAAAAGEAAVRGAAIVCAGSQLGAYEQQAYDGARLESRGFGGWLRV